MYQTRNQRFKNAATKRKGYWGNISKSQCRTEIKNKHIRRKGKEE